MKKAPPGDRPEFSDDRWEENDEPAEAGATPEPAEYRRRRKPVRVRRSRFGDALRFCRAHVRGLLAALLLLVVMAALAHLFFRSDEFILSGSNRIEVRGNHWVPAATVRQVFAADLGRNIFFIPLGQRRAALGRLPWIAGVGVLRLWPDRLQVDLTERVPVAFARAGSQTWLVDAQGVMMPPPAGAGFDFPVLDGLSGGDDADPNSDAAVAQRAAQVQRYLDLRAQLDQGGTPHSGEISEIDLSDPHDAAAVATPAGQSQPVLIHFGDHDYAVRYQKVIAHLAEWRERFPNLPYVDFRIDGQVIVPDGKSGAPKGTRPAPNPGRG